MPKQTAPQPMTRYDHWPPNGPILRRQAPIRVRWCLGNRPKDSPDICRTPSCNEKGERACQNCSNVYCSRHKNHGHHRAVPRDAWWGLYVKLAKHLEKVSGVARVRLWLKRTEDRPMLDYRIDGRIIDADPPARIEFCDVPSSGRTNSPCGYQSKTCTQGSHVCPGCGFTYCERHLEFHVHRIAIPEKLWLVAIERMDRAMDDVLRGNAELVWIRLPFSGILRPPRG